MLRVIGGCLLILGLTGFFYGGFSYTKKEKVIDLGTVEVTAERRKELPMGPLVSGAAMLAGAGLILFGKHD